MSSSSDTDQQLDRPSRARHTPPRTRRRCRRPVMREFQRAGHRLGEADDSRPVSRKGRHRRRRGRGEPTPRQRAAGAREGEPRLANGAGAGVHGRSADAGIADTLCSLAIRPHRNSALFSSDCLAADRRWHDLAPQGTVREGSAKANPLDSTNHWDRLSRSLARESHGWHRLYTPARIRHNDTLPSCEHLFGDETQHPRGTPWPRGCCRARATTPVSRGSGVIA